MPVLDQTSSVTRDWTGVETIFPTGMYALDAAHVVVTTAAGTLLVRDTHYSSELEAGTNFLVLRPLPGIPAAPQTLTIERDTEAVQPDDPENGNTYDADALEIQLNRIVLIAQEVKPKAATARALAVQAQVDAAAALALVDEVVSGSLVVSVNGKSGAVALTKADFSDLNQLDNTSDLNKPVSTATQTALDLKLDDSQATATGLYILGAADAAAARTALSVPETSAVNASLALKAPLSSPALTDVPTAPTAAPGTNTTQISTTAFVQAAVAALVDTSPATLDTLNELAAALGDDPNFAATMTAALAAKLDDSQATVTGLSVLGAADAAAIRTLLSLATIATSASATDLTSGTIADARLPSRLVTCQNVTDWNTATSSGFYMGEGAANAPTVTVWYKGFVVAHNPDWTTQYVWSFTDDSSADTLSYRREQNNTVWGAWYRIRQTEAELDARYAQTADVPELARDALGTALVAGTNITITPNDAGDTITIAASGSVSAAASDVSVVATGGISSTNAQAALAELDTEKVAKSGGTLTGELDLSYPWPTFVLNKPASGTASQIIGKTGDVTLWNLQVADEAPQTGSNTGANFGLHRFDDAGTWLGGVIQANRATGDITLNGGGGVTSAVGGFKYGKAVYLGSAVDLNSDFAAGFYDVSFPVNGPWAVAWAYLHVERHSNDPASWQRQTLTSFAASAGESQYPVVWQRIKLGGTWQPWRPIAGYATPSDFGSRGAGSLAGATTDETAAVTRWIDYGLANPTVPLVLDGFYKITSEISRSIAGLNGFGIRSLGPAARAGFLMSGANGRLTFTGADQSNPSGFDADQYHFSDFMIGVDTDRTNHLIRIEAAADSGSDAPGLQMSNIHVRRSSDTVGVTGDMFYFKDIREFDVSNVSAQGKYGSYLGQMFRLMADAGGAPVEGAFTNCRGTHLSKMFRFEASAGATASDDWQGMHLDRCSGVAVDMFAHATTGTEGFSEWLTVDRCHAYFREIGVYGDNVGNVKVGNSYFLGHGALATIQGIALTGTSVVPRVSLIGNTIKLDAATGASRLGINVPTMGGHAALNDIKGATSNNFGVLTQTANTTF